MLQIELKKESPPEVEPTTDEVLWNQRKEDSTTKFKGMGLVSMMERKDDMGIQQLIDDLKSSFVRSNPISKPYN